MLSTTQPRPTTPKALLHEQTYEPSLADIPSSLEIALNGTSITSYKPITATTTKSPDPNLLDPDTFRRLSTSTVSGISDDGSRGRSTSHASYSRYASRSPAPPRTLRGRFGRFWQRNRGLWLVSMSQFFGALMNVTTRLLELEAQMDPFQILFSRMGITMILCCLYMWYAKIPSAPFGVREVRWLLVLRGLTGFFGIFGMYYSLQYLPLAEATVITFLAPGVASYACYLILGEKFTRIEQIGSIVSLAGVVLIARPTSFFDLSSSAQSISVHSYTNGTTTEPGEFPAPTSAQRLSAIALSLLGVVGSATVFTTIRWIGKRAHPLISVNYFATWCTIVSTLALTVGSSLPEPLTQPNLYFRLPADLRQWGMLLFLGACGFIMQFMMTAGMAHEKSNRATNMVYTQMLFALCFDRWVFGTVPGVWSLMGSGLILGSAIYVAVQKDVTVRIGTGLAAELGHAGNSQGIIEMGVLRDEERAMLSDVDGFRDGLVEANFQHR